MSVLYPLWLWAAAAIAVPAIIHLLSRGRGRVVELGTVRFLPASDSRRLRRIRPTGWWRFLLRAALLAALAVALAAPRWWREAPARPDESWALVDPALVEARPRLEAEAGEVYERLDATDPDRRLLLAPGLPEWREDVASPPVADLWSLVAEAESKLPPGARVEVFALDRAESLRGRRPGLGRPLDWRTVPDPQPNRWIQRLVAAEDGLRVTVGESAASGTTFTSELLALAGAPAPAFDRAAGELGLTDGGSLAEDDVAPIPRPGAELRAAVLSGSENGAPAEVARAASAVGAHLGRPVVLTQAPAGEAPDLVALGRGTDGGLPHALLALVAPGDAGAGGAAGPLSDRRAAPAGTGQPVAVQQPVPAVPDRLPEWIAWVLVAALFLTDRLLARRPA